MMLRGAALLAVLLLGAWSGASRAEEAVPGTDRSLKGDAVCTHCHDETEAKPVLSIYRRRMVSRPMNAHRGASPATARAWRTSRIPRAPRPARWSISTLE